MNAMWFIPAAPLVATAILAIAVAGEYRRERSTFRFCLGFAGAFMALGVSFAVMGLR